MKKRIHDLVPADFSKNSVWKPLDDLTDPDMEVIPYNQDIFNLEEMYIVAAKFKLADGSEMIGYVRFSWGSPIEMALAINNNEFRSFDASRTSETKHHQKFANEINKHIDDVFPMIYYTHIKMVIQGAVY